MPCSPRRNCAAAEACIERGAATSGWIRTRCARPSGRYATWSPELGLACACCSGCARRVSGCARGLGHCVCRRRAGIPARPGPSPAWKAGSSAMDEEPDSAQAVAAVRNRYESLTRRWRPTSAPRSRKPSWQANGVRTQTAIWHEFVHPIPAQRSPTSWSMPCASRWAPSWPSNWPHGRGDAHPCTGRARQPSPASVWWGCCPARPPASASAWRAASWPAPSPAPSSPTGRPGANCLQAAVPTLSIWNWRR